MSTLLYLASGKFYPRYLDLPFEKCYFVDRANLSQSFPQHNPKIKFIQGDALSAIDRLKDAKVKIDCLVSVNEGLYGGGGNYPIFSDFLMGYLSPLLNKEITLICDLNYYVSELRTPMGKVDWGFTKMKRLHQGDEHYMSPAFFRHNWMDTMQEMGMSLTSEISAGPAYHRKEVNHQSLGHVYRMRKNNKKTPWHVAQALPKVSLVHGSIWEDYAHLDLLGLNLLSFHETNVPEAGPQHTRVDEFFRSKKKVLDIRGLSFKEIMEYTQQHGLKKIGLTPWQNKDYTEVLQYLRNNSCDHIDTLTFYHLNKGDYKQLYLAANRPGTP